MDTVLKPHIPYIAPIAKGFSIGREVKIQGTIPEESIGFKIFLLCTSNESGDAPLQIEVNTLTFTAALNSTFNNEKRLSIVIPHISLRSKEIFEIVIQSNVRNYTILINGQVCGHYPKITDMEQANYISIEGQLNVEQVLYTPTSNGFKPNSKLPPPNYEEASQQTKASYGACPLSTPPPGTTPYPTTAPIPSGIPGYQTYLVQTGAFPLQSVTTAPPNNQLHTINTRHVRRSNYKTFLGWICVVFFIIIILLAIVFSRNHHNQPRHHHHELLRDS